jgi:hypothetical protein
MKSINLALSSFSIDLSNEKIETFGYFPEQSVKEEQSAVVCEGRINVSKTIKDDIFFEMEPLKITKKKEKIARNVTKNKNWIFKENDYSYENQLNLVNNLLIDLLKDQLNSNINYSEQTVEIFHLPSQDTEDSFSSTLRSDEKMNTDTINNYNDPNSSSDITIKDKKISVSCDEKIKEEVVVSREIYKKLSGYRYQDIKKGIYNFTLFVNILYVLKLLIESKLKCYYCNENVNVIYENRRDPSQWSLERIYNNEGHNCNNVVIACLKCNLRRKTMLMQRYVETKKMIKVLKLS